MSDRGKGRDAWTSHATWSAYQVLLHDEGLHQRARDAEDGAGARRVVERLREAGPDDEQGLDSVIVRSLGESEMDAVDWDRVVSAPRGEGPSPPLGQQGYYH